MKSKFYYFLLIILLIFSVTLSVNAQSTNKSIKVRDMNDTYHVGEYLGVTWQSTGISNVNVELYNYGHKYHEISMRDGPNSGCAFIIPDDFIEDNTYQIKVSDYDDPSVYDMSNFFSILGGPERNTINVIKPDSSSVWEPRKSYDIIWESTGNVFSVTIDLYNERGLVYHLKLGLLNEGSYTWSPPRWFENSTHYQFKISETLESTGRVTDWSDEFTIVNPYFVDENEPSRGLEDLIDSAKNIPGFSFEIMIFCIWGCSIISVLLIKRKLKLKIHNRNKD